MDTGGIALWQLGQRWLGAAGTGPREQGGWLRLATEAAPPAARDPALLSVGLDLFRGTPAGCTGSSR